MCIAILVGLFLPFFFLITRYFIYPKKEFKGERNILFLSGGSTLEDCYRKFGNFEPLFNYDGPIKSFNRVILFWFLTRNNLTVALRDDYIINERKGIRFFHLTSHLLLLVELLFLVKRKNIKVIRAFDSYQKGLMGWAISKLTGIPFCISIHADYDKCYKLAGRKGGAPLLFKILEKFVLPRAQLVMPIREYLAQKILNKGVSRERIRVIPHGVNIEMFQHEETIDIHKNFGINPGKKVLSFVGRLSKENYVFDMIELTKRLSKLRNDFIILIVGDGPEREEMEALVQEYNLSAIAMFTGFQPREKVISIRRQSFLAICLMGGFSLIEACIAGCPIISYDVEWHYELVKNGETGFLIKENDFDALTEAVGYLLDHPEEAKEMGGRARQLAIERHNISYTSEVKENLYRELLSHGVLTSLLSKLGF
jgi:glycosyltransferase involved in cell wall biosynthesis